jgi:Tol biopolymer transport system component
MYRKRAPYYDILWLDLSGEKAKGVYEDTKVWLWAGWTSDSQGIFLTYAGASIPEDFPETVVEIPDLAIDASNAYAYAISPTEGQAVVLLCKNNTPAIANCDILLAGGDRQVKKLTAEPQGIYWENGISWSPDGSMLAYVAQKDDASKLVVMSVDDQSEQVVSQTAKQTCLIWVP